MIKISAIISSITISVAVLLTSAPPTHAQSAGLAISPPTVEMLLAPNKKVVQTFTVKNQGESVGIIATLHTVTPIDQDGHVRVNPTPLNPANIPLVAKLSPPRFGDEVTLASGASLPLTISFEGATVDAPVDSYLALVVRTVPLTLSGERRPDATYTSPAIAGLIFVTLTPSGVIPANLEITGFEPPFFHDTSLPFTLHPVIKNSADVMIRPTLQLNISNNQGRVVYQPEPVKNLLLKESERDFGPLTWNPIWSTVGPHRIRLTITTEGGTKLTEVEKLVWFLPMRAIIATVLLVLILGIVMIRQRRRITSSLLIIIAGALLLSPAPARASLTSVSDTISTSELSTTEKPIKVRHSIKFTPAKIVPDGYFRILLPADPENASDGIADDEGYDFGGTVQVVVTDAPGYAFSNPVAIPSGDPGCLIPTPYHCFELHYLGTGGVGEPITVLIGGADGVDSLIAPSAANGHVAGTADLAAFIVRHYDATDTMLDYTIGRIGHLESVQVTARVKGTAQPGAVNVVSIPFLPATISNLISRYSLASIILTALAVGSIILILLLLIRRKNILILDAVTQKPVEYFMLYHSLPEIRRPGSPIWLARHEPLSYQASKHNHGKLYIRSLGRYSTLTVRIDETTHILSISRKQRFYTIPL